EGLIVPAHELAWTALIVPVALLIMSAGLWLPPQAPQPRPNAGRASAASRWPVPCPNPERLLLLLLLVGRQDLVLLHVVRERRDHRVDLALGRVAADHRGLREAGPEQLVAQHVVEIRLDAVDLVLLDVARRRHV